MTTSRTQALEALKHAVEGECDGLALTDDQARNILAYIEAAAPSAAEPVARNPGEWKLVPWKPTSDMLSVARVNRAYASCTEETVWSAMLAAAPFHPSEQAQAEASGDAEREALTEIIVAYDHHRSNVAEGLGVVSGAKLAQAIDAGRAALHSTGKPQAIPSPAAGADPLQGAATWLRQALVNCTETDLQQRLLIGFNRAARLIDAEATAPETEHADGDSPCVLEWGAVSLPVGHESRVTEMKLCPTLWDAIADGALCGFDWRVYPLALKPRAESKPPVQSTQCTATADAPVAEPVAHCQLTPSGKIAHFDGKPMVMVGPVGNDCHPDPLCTRPPAPEEGKDAARKPLTDDVISNESGKWVNQPDHISSPDPFKAGVRWAEKQHGITDAAMAQGEPR